LVPLQQALDILTTTMTGKTADAATAAGGFMLLSWNTSCRILAHLGRLLLDGGGGDSDSTAAAEVARRLVVAAIHSKVCQVFERPVEDLPVLVDTLLPLLMIYYYYDDDDDGQGDDHFPDETTDDDHDDLQQRMLLWTTLRAHATTKLIHCTTILCCCLGSSRGDILPPLLFHHDDHGHDDEKDDDDNDHQWLWEMILDCLRSPDRLLRRRGIYILSNYPLAAAAAVESQGSSMLLAWWREYGHCFDALEMESETHLLSPVWDAVEEKLLRVSPAAGDRTTTTTTMIPTRWLQALITASLNYTTANSRKTNLYRFLTLPNDSNRLFDGQSPSGRRRHGGVGDYRYFIVANVVDDDDERGPSITTTANQPAGFDERLLDPVLGARIGLDGLYDCFLANEPVGKDARGRAFGLVGRLPQ
jgi:hypothetical protein